MEITRIFLIVTGSIILIAGFMITTIPDKVRIWLKEWVSLQDNLFYLSGYILGLIGVSMIVIATLVK